MYRFTIRDMLWLTVVVAMAVGWVVDRWDDRATIDALRDELVKTQVFLRKSGGVAEYRRNGNWTIGDNRGNYHEFKHHSSMP